MRSYLIFPFLIALVTGSSVVQVDSAAFANAPCTYSQNWMTYYVMQQMTDMSTTSIKLRKNTVADYSYVTSELLYGFHNIDVYPATHNETINDAYNRVCNDLNILGDPTMALGAGSQYSEIGTAASPLNDTHYKMDFYVKYTSPGRYMSVCTVNAFQGLMAYCANATNVNDPTNPATCLARFKQCNGDSTGCPPTWTLLLELLESQGLTSTQINALTPTDLLYISHCLLSNHRMMIEVLDLECGQFPGDVTAEHLKAEYRARGACTTT